MAVMGLEVLVVAGLALMLAVLCPSGSSALRIGQLQVPSPIRNGSVNDVVLDCDFSLDPGEKSDGIVVKWFLNHDINPTPVYQWIPNKIPQDLGVLKGRVNLGYRATDQPSTRHRALNIINPTIELSGEYRCEVSSFYGEDSKAKKMIIYVPEDKLELTQGQVKSKTADEGEEGETQIRLSCEADGVFPKPELTFMRKDSETSSSHVLEGAEVRVTDRKDGLYDIEADIIVDDSSLEQGSEYAFGCELRIPDAEYSLLEWTNVEARRPATSTSPPTPRGAPQSAGGAEGTQGPQGLEGPEGEGQGFREGAGGGVPLESMHRSADGKERNGVAIAAHPADPIAEATVSCMDNGTALKFRSFRQRHQYKMKCRFSAAASLVADPAGRLSLLLSVCLAAALAALAAPTGVAQA